MSIRTSYAPGIPSWVDVMVPNRDEGKAFYGALFGWTFEDSVDPESGAVIYGNCFSNGHMVCGLMEMNPQMGAMPPVWGTYIATADADETVQRVTAAGGTVMIPPMDVMDVGRMAVFADPSGAVLGLWQAKTHKGAELVNQPYGFCWNELDTRDTAAASSFFSPTCRLCNAHRCCQPKATVSRGASGSANRSLLWVAAVSRSTIVPW